MAFYFMAGGPVYAPAAGGYSTDPGHLLQIYFPANSGGTAANGRLIKGRFSYSPAHICIRGVLGLTVSFPKTQGIVNPSLGLCFNTQTKTML